MVVLLVATSHLNSSNVPFHMFLIQLTEMLSGKLYVPEGYQAFV